MDPRRHPTAVELRQTPGSLVAQVDPLTLRAEFDGLASFPYLAFVWVPGVGSWKVGEVVVGPGKPEVIRLRVPATGRIRFDVELDGALGDGVVLGRMGVPGFNAFGFNPLGIHASNIELQKNPDGHYEVEVFPSVEAYRYSFRSAGAAPVLGTVRVDEGAWVREQIRLAPGREALIGASLPRPLKAKEVLLVEVRRSNGVLSRVECGLLPEVQLTRIPLDAVELVASTNQGLEGRLELVLSRARADEAPVRLEMELVEPR